MDDPTSMVRNALQPTLALEFPVQLWHSSSHEVEDFLKHRLLDKLGHLLSSVLGQLRAPGCLRQSPAQMSGCFQILDRPTLGLLLIVLSTSRRPSGIHLSIGRWSLSSTGEASFANPGTNRL